MAQKQDTGQLIALGVGAFLLIKGITSKKDSGGGSGGSGGGTGVLPTEGEFKVAGGIDAVTVEQGGVATLHRHELLKVEGEPIRVQVTFTTETTDAAGNPMSWPFTILTELGHNTFRFGLPAWKRPIQLNGAWDNGRRTLGPIVQPSGLNDFFAAEFVTPGDDNQEWDIRVKLIAAVADEHGEPEVGEDGLFNFSNVVAEGEHPGAIRSFVASSVSIAGSIDAVDVSNRNW